MRTVIYLYLKQSKNDLIKLLEIQVSETRELRGLWIHRMKCMVLSRYAKYQVFIESQNVLKNCNIKYLYTSVTYQRN
jgi:ribosomal protein L20